MKIPFHRSLLSDAEVDAAASALRSGWLTSGPAVKAFEEAFAQKVGATHAVAVSSATMGAMLALSIAGIRGHDLYVPAMTFSSPAMMAWRLGMRVKIVDVDPDTLLMLPEQVSEATGKDVVMPTHYAGQPAPVEDYEDAAPYSVVVDDAAHAFPAMYPDGTYVGGQSEVRVLDPGVSGMTLFSFYATKTLTTCEGGMVTTGDDLTADLLRQYRLHGMSKPMEDRYTNPATGWWYDIENAGWKANMPDPLAAIGLAGLDQAEARLAQRRWIAQQYRQELSGYVRVPADVPGHAWHLFVIRVKDRDRFIERMAERGVQCSVHFRPLHQHSFWQGEAEYGCPNADAAYREIVSLPLFPTMTEAEVGHVIESVIQSA